MDNPDPTIFITILDHKAALVAQQKVFDDAVSAAVTRAEEVEAKASCIIAAKAAIADGKLDAEATIAAIDAEIKRAERPETDKRRAEIESQMAELAQKLAELP